MLQYLWILSLGYVVALMNRRHKMVAILMHFTNNDGNQSKADYEMCSVKKYQGEELLQKTLKSC